MPDTTETIITAALGHVVDTTTATNAAVRKAAATVSSGKQAQALDDLAGELRAQAKTTYSAAHDLVKAVSGLLGDNEDDGAEHNAIEDAYRASGDANAVAAKLSAAAGNLKDVSAIALRIN